MTIAEQRYTFLALLIGCLYSVGNVSVTIAFSPTTTTSTTLRHHDPIIITQHHQQRYDSSYRRIPSGLKGKGSDGNDNDTARGGLINRFLNPRLDDPFLPLTEAGLVQVVGPTLQLFWLVSLDSPYPSWAQPFYDYTFAPQGAFLAPTLIHGAGLACCWLLGCLAARSYELPNFRAQDGDYSRVVSSTIQAGAFACGILILATQFDLYQELGGFVQVGDSPESDVRIYRALVEVINDIFFEFIVLLPWRLFRSNFD